MKLITLLLLSQVLLFSDSRKLIKIVDGDTLYFKINNKTVKCRIGYIDTPESYMNKKLKNNILIAQKG
jgi:endonuclease YncB( thermonuclease family)